MAEISRKKDALKNASWKKLKVLKSRQWYALKNSYPWCVNELDFPFQKENVGKGHITFKASALEK